MTTYVTQGPKFYDVYHDGSAIPPIHVVTDSGYRYWRQEVEFVRATKRKKPVGIELLFNGTGLQLSNQRHFWGPFRYQGADPLQYTITSMIGVASAGTRGPLDIPDVSGQLHAKLKNQKVNLALAMAEYRQTASLFADAAKRVAGAYRSLRRGDVIGMYNALGGRGRTKASSNWLAFQYGVRPLVSDFYGSLDQFRDTYRVKPVVFKVRVNHKVSEFDLTKINSGGEFGIWTTHRKSNQRWTCYYTVDNEASRLASQTGFTNPLSLAWELVPYSFVVDWFVNVGDWLSSIDTLTGVDRSVAYHGVQSTESGAVVMNSGGMSLYDGKWTTRSGPQTVPSVRLQWEPSLSWRRITSGVALLKQSRS